MRIICINNCSCYCVYSNLDTDCETNLNTWILVVVSKQLRLLHGRNGDSTTVVNSLSPQMSELVEDAVASWCGDIVWHFWLIRNEPQKFVELKFEFFSFNTFDVSQIFWHRVVQPRAKYSYCISWSGCAEFLFVGYWITHCVLRLECFLVCILYSIVPSLFGTICWCNHIFIGNVCQLILQMYLIIFIL